MEAFAVTEIILRDKETVQLGRIIENLDQIVDLTTQLVSIEKNPQKTFEITIKHKSFYDLPKP